MKMILHQNITMHFDPAALRAFSQTAQKLPSISIFPENLFPSISARKDVVDGTGKPVHGQASKLERLLGVFRLQPCKIFSIASCP